MRNCIKKKSKRHFQLLEVLIAIFLIVICALPAMHIFTKIYEGQTKGLRINQRDHLTHLIHAKIVEKLYKQEIPFEEILAGKQEKFEEASLKGELDKLQYEASYKIKFIDPAKEKKQQEASELIGEIAIVMLDKAKGKEEAEIKYLFYLGRQERGAKKETAPKKEKEADEEENDED
ncbi:MAG: hypothetical protein LW832_02740 [Parachlamydia sp.]|jgi:hypothetical protein|nr:hypothetical protein [Parachlamydia sp.]